MNRPIHVYTSNFSMSNTNLPVLPCLCASFRRASRTVTQHYDEALRPLGIRATQFTVLQALSITGEVSQGKLGQILAIDSTTLTRTLGIMSRRGWISKRRGTDRREWRLRLAPAGRDQFERALPSWEKTQGQLASQLGDKRWQDLFELVNKVAALTSE